MTHAGLPWRVSSETAGRERPAQERWAGVIGRPGRTRFWLAVAGVCGTLASLATSPFARAAQTPPAWSAVGEEATRVLQGYVRIDTSDPPGDTRKAADYLASILQREGIPFTRYESEPTKSIIVARLKATVPAAKGKAIVLMHHMDVVPADKSRWPMDPFAALIRNGELWGRGSMDMKGLGVAHLMAFLELKRQHVPLSRDVILLANPDEEMGGGVGARWMIEHHLAELDPEYVLDEGGFASRDVFSPGKLVYGISVAEKKIVWLKVRAEGVAGHGSQPNPQNPNDHLARALARLIDNPAPLSDFSVVRTMKAKLGTFADNKFTNAIQRSTTSLTWLRSGVGEPPKINVIPSVAEAGLDCRVMPGTTRDQWIAEVKQKLGDPSLKVELVSESDDPVVTPIDTPLYRNLEAAITRLHPEAIVTPILIPYGTDSNAFRPHGVKSYGIFPAILSADIVASMHSDGEHVPLAGVQEAAQVFFEALKATLAP
jgi:acetylornithine deacetylase/succinyl-diaminopimelate desuccinylase-like protein